MLKTIISISLVSFLTIISQFFLKKGLMKMGGIKISSLSDFSSSFLRLLQEKYIYVGAIIAIIAAFWWLIIIFKKDLTFVFPISGGIFYILLFLSAWIFLGEAITFWKISGVILILLGITLIIK